MLDAHLDRCAECARVAVETSEATAALRSAPLAALALPIPTPRRRHTRLRPALTAAAAVLVVAGGLSTALQPAPREEAPTTTFSGGASAVDDRQLRDVQRAQLKAELAMLQTNFQSEIGHVT